MTTKSVTLVVLLGFSVLFSGCGPSRAERAAAERERQRLELEEKTRREMKAAHEAITEMNKKRYGKLTPEERAAREAERDRTAQKYLDEWKAQEAKQAAEKSAEKKQP